eukprot:CAMPEP_0180153886 /NCGR_PEP_ID=MMETSP0986-20121125/23813_1 /TAXON_ID=697907 /ORGANISM="non described non described, Strain CCMP2293" /LENGTH=61 /DNA_ID=CAMNT_0022102101 /DNA_START=19 /DNA_END=204 /DNA_ORIENTATION=-
MFEILSGGKAYYNRKSCPLAFPRPGESDTVENWAEKLNAEGLTPNSHPTILDCGGTNTRYG